MHALRVALFACLLAVLLWGCAGPNYTTSPYHPGPAVGTAAGAVVGFGEGVIRGGAAPFDTTTRMIRVWQEETTADGRKIMVPRDILVDAEGRPVQPGIPNLPTQ
jgi:hypothetical protein